jgi:hypothetical protein
MFRLIARAKGLLLSPSAEWDAIAGESDSPRRLVGGFLLPMAAIPAMATFFGLAVVGVRNGEETFRVPAAAALGFAACVLGAGLAGVFALAFLLNMLAPSFGAARDWRKALKLSAYSATAVLASGAGAIVPMLGVLVLIGGGYSLYLLYLGAPRLVGPASDSAANYSIASIGAASALMLVAGLAGALAFAQPSGLLPQSSSLRRFASILLNPAAGQLPVAAAQHVSVTEDDLRTLAPPTLNGLRRVSVKVEAADAAGVKAIALDARYETGSRRLGLKIVHSLTLDSVIGFGGPQTSEYDRATDGGYQRRRREGAAIMLENWDEGSGAGAFGRVAGGDFYFLAEGRGGMSIADLRSIVMRYSDEQLDALRGP